MKSKLIVVGALLVLLTLALTACTTAAPTSAPAAPAATQAPCPTAAPCPTCPTCPPPQPTPIVKAVPNAETWVKSGHNAANTEPFKHWDTAQDKVIPEACARCHSTPGYIEYVSTGKVSKPVAIGTTITCEACHNDATVKMTSVKFPSGLEVKNLGPQAICMQCHQGAASGKSVDAAVEKAGGKDAPDKVSADLAFINQHYFAAAATLYGKNAGGGYEYAGKIYDAKNEHVKGYDNCLGCHNQHSLELKVKECAACHTGVASKDDLKKIRMVSSPNDYNGNGDVKEGMAAEIDGLRASLLKAIQAYGKEKGGKAIGYNAAVYPYFFNDTNADGKIDDAEAKFENAYKSWTPRLLKAAYNYQVATKDPGAYAHGGKYIIDLVYDSIADLNASGMTGKVDMSKMVREDAGHFNGSSEPFRHWDADPDNGVVPEGCAKCHSSTGLPNFLKNTVSVVAGVDVSKNVSVGASIKVPASNGFRCDTCHQDLVKGVVYKVDSVRFPSGVSVSLNDASNICMQCHQGRESKFSIDAKITAAGVKNDEELSAKLSFTNPHYFAAGATLFGSDTHGAYEFKDQKYNQRNLHVDAANVCSECHDPHKLDVKVDKCASCHGTKTVADLPTIRKDGDKNDYDGNGKPEGIGLEVKGLEAKLYAAIQAYGTKNKKPIAYSATSYPYFFNDTNANGKVDPDEAKSANAYSGWTANLLRAAYNYQWVQKDPGAYAHNGHYIIQILFDSVKAVGGDMKGLARGDVKVNPTPTPAPKPTTAPAAGTPAPTTAPAAGGATPTPTKKP
jgi:hypothetical protein